MAETKPENLFLNRAKYVMKILGVWIPLENESISRKIYRYFIMILQYLFLFLQLLYIAQVWGEWDEVVEASFLLFTQACLCFKLIVLHRNVDTLKVLLQKMNSDIFKAKSDVHERILNDQANKIKRLLLAFVVSAQVTIVLWALKPLLDDAGTRKFPFDMWLPLNTELMLDYVFGYLFQIATICISAYLYFGIDSVTFSMVIFSCAQMEIIKDKLSQIQHPQCGKSEVAVNSKRILKDNVNILKECAKQHQATVSFTEMVENSYHSYLLFQLCGSVGIFCMSALQILMIDWRSMQFMSIIVYLIVMVSQLFLCCWCGHELTDTSERLHAALYQCAWYTQSMEFKKLLLFTMMRMERPMVFRAGHYVILSRQTFVAILRMSYSYVAVLNQTVKD